MNTEPSKAHHPKITPQSVHGRFKVLIRDAEGETSFDPAITEIRLDSGKLVVGEVPIKTARFSSEHVTWVQQSTGSYTSGHLYVNPKTLTISGRMHRGTTPDDAVRVDFIGAPAEPGSASVVAVPPSPRRSTRSRRIVAKPARWARAAPGTAVTGPTSGLSIDELMTFLPSREIEEESRVLLLRNMKWAMGQDRVQKEWLKSYFGVIPPDLDADAKAAAQKSISWYQNNMARAYLTHAFANYDGANRPSINLSDGQKKAVATYMTEGLAKTRDFGIQQPEVYLAAFKAHYPRLQLYLDEVRRELWAKQLFDEITSPEIFGITMENIKNAIGNAEQLKPAKNWATLLTVLQPSGELAKDYYTAILNSIITTESQYVVHRDRDTIQAWLPTTLETYLRMIAEGQISEEVSGISIQQSKDMLDDLITNGTSITSALGEMFAAVEAADFYFQVAQISDTRFQPFALKHPRWAAFGNSLLIIGWIGALACVIAMLKHGDFKAMDGLEKGKFITSLLQTNLAFPTFLRAVKAATRPAWDKAVRRFGWDKKWLSDLGGLEDDWASHGGPEEIDEYFAQKAAKTQEIELKTFGEETALTTKPPPAQSWAKSAWSKIFREGESLGWGVLRLLNVGLALATIGLSAWQLAKDVRDGESGAAIAFDSFNLVNTFVVGVCLIAEIAFETWWIPCVGAFVAIAGAIVGFIAMLVVKPKNPLNEFLRWVGVPFARQLELTGRTLWNYEIENPTKSRPARTTDNEVDLSGRELWQVLIRRKGGYGITNIQFTDGNGNDIIPKKPYKDTRLPDEYENAWVCPENYGEVIGSNMGQIDGIQLGYQDGYGMINLRIHRKGMPDWDQWMTPDIKPRNYTEPLIAGTLKKIRTCYRKNYGIVDFSIEYADRIQ